MLPFNTMPLVSSARRGTVVVTPASVEISTQRQPSFT